MIFALFFYWIPWAVGAIGLTVVMGILIGFGIDQVKWRRGK